MEEFADCLPRGALMVTLWLSAGKAELNSESSNSLQSEVFFFFSRSKAINIQVDVSQDAVFARLWPAAIPGLTWG